jgi:putative Holliday junction resolvase
MMRTLAIDPGAKRVGLALSDEGGQIATPYDVIEVASPKNAIDQIAPLVAREDVERLVVGLPLNMDGSVGPAARSTIDWGRKLAERCGKPVVFVDERLSSFAAEQDLIDRKRAGEKLTRKRKQEQLDAMAAAGFLQAFLDGAIPPIKILLD